MIPVLGALAVVCLVALLLATPGTTSASVARALTAAASFILAGLTVAAAARPDGWPGQRALGMALGLVGAMALLFGLVGAATDRAFEPHTLDVLLLVVLAPFIVAARDEFSAHFDAPYRREVIADVAVLALSLAAIAYIVIVPPHAGAEAAISAATFAVLGGTIIGIFGALALWVPVRSHLLAFAAFGVVAFVTIWFGHAWAAGTSQTASGWISVVYVLAPPSIACMFLLVPHEPERIGIREPVTVVRPVLTSITVIAASGALSLVAIMDDARGIAGAQATVILMVLGTAIAVRILINQLASAEAYTSLRAAVADSDGALRDTDAALERVREANESLTSSEEHLRLVFEAAVDGFVEVDHEGVIIRANDAFARMISTDAGALTGLPWTALATVVDGADASFAQLLEGAHATIERSDGQVVHLESTASQIPTEPPRRLLLVRDVTAGKVADQTIRSLFHFLQDRDEDRTRLSRRLNAAIEQERNKIARDLHDGPVQGVSAASLSLEAALLMIKSGDVERGTEVLVKIRQELAGEADALRQLMAGLRPPVLEERGLMPALRETVARFEGDTGIVSSFEGDLKRPVPRDIETLAYRIVQESLSNIGKHANATTVMVHLDTDDNQLRVEVEDDGQGFETTQARDYLRAGRVGLASMRERVELASGTFNLRSSPGRGTVITALIPLDESLLAAPAI
ncbi:MAG TPA: PAS domain-containing sensor histidine kinase [Actinomycetota bacterium]|nr:PAS domain-containing sensor histidine kinase [Actinomycetota bacterium]